MQPCLFRTELTRQNNNIPRSLNYHVRHRLATNPPGRVSRKQFSHPERGRPSWINLGNLATQYGTSTHHMDKKDLDVTQDFWDRPDVTKQDPSTARYDNFEKAAELARKLGK